MVALRMMAPAVGYDGGGDLVSNGEVTISYMTRVEGVFFGKRHFL